MVTNMSNKRKRQNDILRIRVDEDLKNKFEQHCIKNRTTMSQEIKSFMLKTSKK